MQASPDVADALRRFYAAFSSGEPSELAAVLADDSAFLLVGSNEMWMRDRATVLSQLSAESAALSPRIAEDEIAAFEDGDVGWASDRPTMTLPSGIGATFRYTTVWRRLEGSWQMIQSHLSVPVPDEEVFPGT